MRCGVILRDDEMSSRYIDWLDRATAPSRLHSDEIRAVVLDWAQDLVRAIATHPRRDVMFDLAETNVMMVLALIYVAEAVRGNIPIQDPG